MGDYWAGIMLFWAGVLVGAVVMGWSPAWLERLAERREARRQRRVSDRIRARIARDGAP